MIPSSYLGFTVYRKLLRRPQDKKKYQILDKLMANLNYLCSNKLPIYNQLLNKF